MKKIFSILGLLILCVWGATFFQGSSVKKDSFEYDESVENAFKRQRYSDTFEEYEWIKEQYGDKGNDLFLSFKFLDALFSRDYAEYLALFIGAGEKFRFRFDEFSSLCDRLEALLENSSFAKDEFSEVLFYSLILSKIKNSAEYKQRAWIYDASDLSEMLVLHPDTFPTMKRFSKDQQKFVRLILEGFVFEGCLDNFRHNIAYNIDENCPMIHENIEYFDLSFLMFICRMAGHYARFGKETPDFTSGYFSYLSLFEKDLVAHLRRSF